MTRATSDRASAATLVPRARSSEPIRNRTCLLFLLESDRQFLDLDRTDVYSSLPLSSYRPCYRPFRECQAFVARSHVKKKTLGSASSSERLHFERSAPSRPGVVSVGQTALLNRQRKEGRAKYKVSFCGIRCRCASAKPTRTGFLLPPDVCPNCTYKIQPARTPKAGGVPNGSKAMDPNHVFPESDPAGPEMVEESAINLNESRFDNITITRKPRAYRVAPKR
jgi:hypothetical protein